MILFRLAVLVALALAPSSFLYFMFDSNEAHVAWLDDKVTLGGPIAAFCVLFFGLWKAHKHMREVEVSSLEGHIKKIRWIEGEWDLLTISNGDSGRRAVSTIKFVVDKTSLKVRGGPFYDQTKSHPTRKNIGRWDGDLKGANFDGHTLRYDYDLMDNNGSIQNSKGIVTADWNQSTKSFEGFWEVVGSERHHGTITISNKNRKD